MKLMVMGYGGHGKDTVCEILAAEHGLPYLGSSRTAGEVAVYPTLKDKYGYPDFEACYADRSNHRKEWFDLIAEYNEDPTRLARHIYEQAPVYCGIRSRREFEAVRAAQMFDWAIWVDASLRLQPEESDSNELTRADADVVFNNNGPEEMLSLEVKQWVPYLRAFAATRS